MKLWRTLTSAAAVLVLAGCGSFDPAGPGSTASPGPQAADACPQYARGARAVSFGINGAHNLLGLQFGTGPVGIVLAHQVDTTLCNWMPVARKLAARGYRVLAFDFNGFGVSSGIGSDIDKDVAAAAGFLRADGATSIVLIGASMGGTAVVVAAADITPPVRAVVEFSGPSTFGNVSANGAVVAPRLRMPVLYVASTDDTTAATGAQTLYDSTPAANRTLVLIPGIEHGVALLNVGGTLQGWAPLNDFLAAHAPAAAAPTGVPSS